MNFLESEMTQNRGESVEMPYIIALTPPTRFLRLCDAHLAVFRFSSRFQSLKVEKRVERRTCHDRISNPQNS